MRMVVVIAVQLAAHAAAAERTLVAINAGGRSCMHEGTVMEQDRYYLGGVTHATTANHPALPAGVSDGAAEDDDGAAHSVLNTSRVGPVIMYSIPVPGNAGDNGRGWDFTMSLLFDKHLALEAPFDGPVIADIKMQGVIVEQAVRLSGGRGARSVITVPLTIDPVRMVLFLQGANAAVPFGGFVHVEITPVGGEIAHVSALRLLQPTFKTPAAAEVGEDNDNEEPGWIEAFMSDTVVGWAVGSIPGQAALLYVVFLGLQRGGSSLRRQASEFTMAARTKDQGLTEEVAMEPAGEELSAEKQRDNNAAAAAANRGPARRAADEVDASHQRRKRRPRKVLSADEVARQRQMDEAAMAAELAARVAAAERSASAQASVDDEEKDTAEALARTSATVVTKQSSPKAKAKTHPKARAAGTGGTASKRARGVTAGGQRPGSPGLESDLAAAIAASFVESKTAVTKTGGMVLRPVPLEALFVQPVARAKSGRPWTPSSSDVVEQSLSDEADSASSDNTWPSNSVIDSPPSSPSRPARLQLDPATTRSATGKGGGAGDGVPLRVVGTWAQRVSPRTDEALQSESESDGEGGESGDDDVEDEADGREAEGETAWTPRADAAAWSPEKKKRKRRRRRKRKAPPPGLDLPHQPLCHFGQGCLRPDCPFFHPALDQMMMLPPSCNDLLIVPPPPSSLPEDEDVRAQLAAQGFYLAQMTQMQMTQTEM